MHNDRKVSFVVITGGPCSGKTTLLSQARAFLDARGVEAIVLSEVATELIQAGFSPERLGPTTFQRHLFTYSLAREDMYGTMARRLRTDRPVVVLCDRGVLDGAAYLPDADFAQLMRLTHQRRTSLLNRYRMVIHMVTTANGAEAHYTLQNNRARSESLEHARELDERTQRAWLGHNHFCVIDNSTDFAGKMQRAFEALRRVLNMPKAREIERKFVVRDFTTHLIPRDAELTAIDQTYLESAAGLERRLRRSTHRGVITYYYAEKVTTTEVGVREEDETIISRDEYLKLLADQDAGRQGIKKRRYTFVFEGRHFELDVYDRPAERRGLAILEVELLDMAEQVTLPPWKLEEVTGDPAYSNRALAAAN